MPTIKDHPGRQAARWFHALSDETRLQILDQLTDGEQCVCDLMDALGSAQSRLSFHLKTLKEAGLLKDRREGRWIYYSLDPNAVQELQNFVARFAAGAVRRIHSRRCE